MSMHFRDLTAQAAADGAISAEEILTLRGAGWADGQMDPEEAESLFLANEALRNPGPDWCDFFVEALSEFVVNTVEPHGYVDQLMGDELVSRIDRDGRIGTMTELELLVRVLEKALSVPDSLKAYALRQLEDIVLSGEGPTRAGVLDPKGINEVECRLLRRVIFAAGGDRPAAASRAEAQQQQAPDLAGAWYWEAYALGRYSQGISVAKALAQGLGLRIKTALETTLRLAPHHADAHLALAAFHAEVIDKVGSLIGGMTYGARKDTGLALYQQALALNPDSPITLGEYASGLLMLEGESAAEQALSLQERCAAFEPLDAMERLYVDAARVALRT